MECLRLRSQPRDASAGPRRGQCLGILGTIATMRDLPEAAEIAHQALRRGREQEARGAILFFAQYFESRMDLDLPEEISLALQAFVKKSANRANVSAALSLLVNTREIFDFEAYEILDSWQG